MTAPDLSERAKALAASLALTADDVDVITAALTAVREETLEPFRELFCGGPDTACRTTWRDHPGLTLFVRERTECVEVPIDLLREAFATAGEEE